ncbi:hypothetical protein J6590_047812 [Homalodisca vitripennis]|nr:hypothetical protein J6590_047812 [Homalodisca vitripennis]
MAGRYQSRCQSPTRPARAVEASIYLLHYQRHTISSMSGTFLKPVVAYKTLTGTRAGASPPPVQLEPWRPLFI